MSQILLREHALSRGLSLSLDSGRSLALVRTAL
jgi:hypothetical protein